MKQEITAHPRAIALLLAAVALPISPVLGQEAAPPVAATTPAPPAATPAPAPAAVAPTFAPSSPVVQNVPPPGPRTPVAEAAPEETAAPAPARRTARAPARPATVTRAPAAAPVAAPAPAVAEAPVEAPPPAPVAEAPAPVAAAPLEAPVVETPAPAPSTSGNIWVWLVAGLAVLAALIGLVLSRRRKAAQELYYDETPAYAAPLEPVDPLPSVDPLTAAAPIVPIAAAAAETQEDVSVTESSVKEMDAMVAAADPVADRPWIELGMRPVRAGTSRDDAVVEFELTVGNAGTVVAKDVRVSTWMFTTSSSDAERALIDPPHEAALTELTIEPGDGKRVDASLALPKSDVHVSNGNGQLSFTPVVVADVRYPLPDGTEGRISASFEIGMIDCNGGDLTPFAISGSPDMHDNVDARLHGELERA